MKACGSYTTEEPTKLMSDNIALNPKCSFHYHLFGVWDL